MSTTSVSLPSQTQSQDGSLDGVLLSFNSKINKINKQVQELEKRVNQIDRQSHLSLTTGNNVAGDMVHLKDEVEDLKGCLSSVTELLIQSKPFGAPNEPTPRPEGASYIIGRVPPSICAKLTAIVLTILALIAITMLIICIVTVCGGFPLFISLLNMYTVGACISLPIISCAAVSMMILCTLSIGSLLRSKPAIYMINNSQIES
ncbi:inclusion membrane protein IncB [Chlamydia sp. 12-01]|uniref:inclusion membrane protein IncB n=1 Tax=Chlamydia sp. 12-01 TaxID=3002742 RepID=UPI0035D46586